MSDSIRFATWTRVSTDKQEEHGHSLETQRRRIEAAVKAPHRIVARYGATSESATEGHERREFDRLLADVTRGLFDAVIIADDLRFSRDPIEGGRALGEMRDAGVRLFVCDVELNLWNPADVFRLSVTQAAGQYQIATQLVNSRRHRIDKAKLGYPTAGGLVNVPWGFECTNWQERKAENVPAQWTPPDKRCLRVARKTIEMIVRHGKTRDEVAAVMRQNRDFVATYVWPPVDSPPALPKNDSNVANTLFRRLTADAASGTWVQEFKGNRGERVPVPTKLPGVLLTENEVKVLKHHLKANKIVHAPKHEHALSRLCKCHCGSVLLSQSGDKYQYFAHHQKTFKKGCVRRIRVGDIEHYFFHRVGALLLDHDGLDQAIRDGVAAKNTGTKEIERELRSLRKAIVADQKALRDETAKLIARGKTAGPAVDQINRDIDAIEVRLIANTAKRDGLEAKVARYEVPVASLEYVKAVRKAIIHRYSADVLRWPDGFKRKIARWLVGATGSLKSTDRGIYVRPGQYTGPDPDAPQFEVRGAMATFDDNTHRATNWNDAKVGLSKFAEFALEEDFFNPFNSAQQADIRARS